MSVYMLWYINTQYSVSESSPVMDSRVASYRPAFWKSKNIVRALKFGPRILISKNWKNNYGIADRKINERIIVLPVKIRWLILKDSTESVLRESFKNFTNVRSSCSKWTPLVRIKKRTPKHQDVCIFGKNALSKNQDYQDFAKQTLSKK